MTVETLDVTWEQRDAHAAGRIGLARGQPLDVRFDVNALAVPSLLALAGQDPTIGAGHGDRVGHRHRDAGEPRGHGLPAWCRSRSPPTNGWAH